MPRRRIAVCPNCSSATAAESNNPTRTRMVNWTADRDLLLLGILKEQQIKGNGVSENFSAPIWLIILEEFKRNSPLEVKKENLQNRLKVLKQLYALYNALANRSGWSWDHARSMPIAPQETEWPDIIAANPNYKKIKGVAFPQYDDMHFLCGGNIAVDYNGISTNMDNLSVDGSSDDDNDLEGVAMSALNIDTTGLEENAENLFMNTDPTQSTGQGNNAEPSSLSAKWRRSVNPTISSRRRKMDKYEGLDVLVDVGKQNADVGQQKVQIAKEFLKCEVAGRPDCFSVKDCMEKLNVMLQSGLNLKLFIASSEAIEDERKRDVFMTLEGIPLCAWLERQVEVQEPHKPFMGQAQNSDKSFYPNNDKSCHVPNPPSDFRDASLDWAHL